MTFLGQKFKAWHYGRIVLHFDSGIMARSQALHPNFKQNCCSRRNKMEDLEFEKQLNGLLP